uniref:ZP domain-containing protein n=1 Tax=Kryptolebias marmoratus TaxID=37003 RepID=A0A3Q3AEA9_KRYMA
MTGWSPLLSCVPVSSGAVGHFFNDSTKFNISLCPVTFYGQKYEDVYINFTSQNFVVCFDGFYDPQAGGDCLLGPQTISGFFNILPNDQRSEQQFLQDVPTINAMLGCYIFFVLNNDVSGFGIVFHFFNILFLKNIKIKNRTTFIHFSGVVYRTNTTTVIPEFCETVQCSDTAVLNPTTTPPPPSHSICTVTGPTVIDFSSHLDSVKDQCDYYLLQIQGVSVVGNFLERRLKDVSFLDSVTLEVNGVHIRLKQGGGVPVDGTPLNLDSSPQVVHGVQLSKDQTGVTAMLQIGNLKITIFFDGSCNLLNEAPFTSCPINPEPYITACTDTLSTYPAMDGLKCQFLQAYVKACSLFSNTTLEGWGSKAECSSEAFCQDRTCSHHEFCGEDSYYGDTRCFCRANFASCYRNGFGEPTVCRQNNAYLTLAICLLEDRGIKYSALHLNDPTCTGQVDQQNHMVTFSFNSSNCGTEIMTNGSQIIYMNTIMTQNFTSDMIIRHDDVMIDFSCYHVQPDIETVSFTIVDSDVSKALTAGPWTYTVFMKAYIDNEYTKPVERYHNLQMNQRVWVKLDTKGLNGNMIAVVIDACWATNQPSATASKKYYLIENGCPNPADPTVMIKGNGEGTTSYFSFNMFRFSGGSNEIYLHCSLHLCLKEKGNCAKTCGTTRRHRSASSSYKSDSFISMGWTH